MLAARGSPQAESQVFAIGSRHHVSMHRNYEFQGGMDGAPTVPAIRSDTMAMIIMIMLLSYHLLTIRHVLYQMHYMHFISFLFVEHSFCAVLRGGKSIFHHQNPAVCTLS